MLLTTGFCSIVAAVAVLTLFLSRGHGTVGTLLTAISTVVIAGAVLLAIVLNVRPPVVLTLDPIGFRTRGKGGEGKWKDVQDVGLADGVLQFTDASGVATGLPLDAIDRTRHAELVAEVYERLNTAHGYQRFEFGGE